MRTVAWLVKALRKYPPTLHVYAYETGLEVVQRRRGQGWPNPVGHISVPESTVRKGKK